METIYSRLRQWRLALAREMNLPVFFILSNRHLAAVAAAHPTTLEELSACPGIGPKKLSLFGDSLVSLIAACLEEQLEPGVFLAEPEAPAEAESRSDSLTQQDLADIANSLRREMAQRIARRFKGRFSVRQVEEALKRLAFTA